MMVSCQLCSKAPVDVTVEGLFRVGSPTSKVSNMTTRWRACRGCAVNLVAAWEDEPLFLTYSLAKDCGCACPNRGTLTHAVEHESYWPGGES